MGERPSRGPRPHDQLLRARLPGERRVRAGGARHGPAGGAGPCARRARPRARPHGRDVGGSGALRHRRWAMTLGLPGVRARGEVGCVVVEPRPEAHPTTLPAQARGLMHSSRHTIAQIPRARATAARSSSSTANCPAGSSGTRRCPSRSALVRRSRAVHPARKSELRAAAPFPLEPVLTGSWHTSRHTLARAPPADASPCRARP
jgi:hypothetical protein